MKQVSQCREPIEASEYIRVGNWIGTQVVLMNKFLGTYHLYALDDDYDGHVIEIAGLGYRFVRDALMGDLWWAGIKIRSGSRI